MARRRSKQRSWRAISTPSAMTRTAESLGADHHGLADVGGGHRVAVGVEAYAGLLADDGRDDRVGVEGASRQRSQTGAFDEQSLARALAGGGVDAVVGDLVAPLRRLGADVVERAEGAAVEERVADVLDGALDAALGLGVAHGGGGGLEQVVTGEREQTRVELHRGADVVQDGALEVVVENLARHAPEELQGAAVHQQEGLGLLVEREVQEQRSRPASAPSRRPTGAAASRRSASGRSCPSPPGPARRAPSRRAGTPSCCAGRARRASHRRSWATPWV